MTTKSEKCPTCGADAINRSEYWEAYPENGKEIAGKLYEIEKAVKRYYLALDNHEHGYVAATRAFDRVQEILGMCWEQGQMTKLLEEYPKMAAIYMADGSDSPTAS